MPRGEAVHGIVHLVRDHVRVRVEVMNGAKARVAHVVEEVGELQRRAQQEDHVEREHGECDRAHRDRPHRRQQHAVSDKHRQDHAAETDAQRGGVVGQPPEEAMQRTRLPGRKRKPAPRHEDRGAGGREYDHRQRADDQRRKCQAAGERAERNPRPGQRHPAAENRGARKRDGSARRAGSAVSDSAGRERRVPIGMGPVMSHHHGK